MDTVTSPGLIKFEDAGAADIEAAMQESAKAFIIYRRLSLKQRANFLRAIAVEIESLGDELLHIAAAETNLSLERLAGERTRTLFQLRSYADACEHGDHLDIRIDHSKTGKPDLRKMMFPLGPVLVFGAANFPFAYSTAGGDTACALAAGCPVIVKAHPAHSNTSELVARAIHRAVELFHLPQGLFIHLHGASNSVGQALVEHPVVTAVGFTGSFAGGTQLAQWAAQRKVPVPVFAEMSSINPVFILPAKLSLDSAETAEKIAASVVLGVGQFCTNPGLLVVIDNDDASKFILDLGQRINQTMPGVMLNPGIFKNYVEKRANALAQPEVEMSAVSADAPGLNQGAPTLAVTTAQVFMANPLLHSEVFGPYTLVVKCSDENEMLEVARSLEGQLTMTLIATEEEIIRHQVLAETLQFNCGRFILNGVPTGVEVCLSMQHGGPFPATTDSRFTSVGADGIKRFVRPITFQNWPDHLLPAELRNENAGGLWRTVNNKKTKDSL
ncbi:MAG: aldehyde dehydrogenase (NADP(+)) [Chitinophagaceae bacterium]